QNRIDAAAILFLQSFDRSETVLDRFESRRIVANRIVERGKRTRGFLQAIDDLLQIIGDRMNRFDVPGERLQQVRGARELRESGVLVLLNCAEGSGRRLGHLSRVAEDASLGAN